MLRQVNPVLMAPNISPDERQREAIEHVQGPLLVIAGAGTGKTTVLTQRIANLIRAGHAVAGEVLALTYTENAALEIQNRVRSDLQGQNAAGLRTFTFHAWCNDLLQRRGASFRVLDEKDLWVFLRQRIRDLRLKYFVRAANVGQFLDSLLEFMRRCQDQLVGPEVYAAYVARLERGEIPLPRVAKTKKQAEMPDEEVLDRCREIARVFAMVEQMLVERNLGTFGHMITRAYDLLKRDPAVLDQERTATRFVLVDEFQDANFAQVEVLALLAGDSANVFAVGDPDQAIYQFRGASSEAFNLFGNRFPATQVVVLGKNRRSLTPILRSAFGIVNDNPALFSKNGARISYQRAPLDSWREDELRKQGKVVSAPPVEVVTWRDREVEAADLARHIQKRHKELRCPWSHFAVLYRQHFHREDLVKELIERSIPFSIEGLDVLGTPEVRDVIACLTAAVSPNDAASLFRVAALPQFAIDPAELRAGMRSVRRDQLDLRTVLLKLKGGAILMESVDRVHEEVSREGVQAVNAANLVVRHFGLQRSVTVQTFLNFVEVWHKRPIAGSGSPSEFLQYLDYFAEAKGTIPLPASQEDGIRLLTAHAAKGLEFPYVAVLRGSSTWFPCAYHEPLIAFPRELRTGESTVEDKILHEEEERRLFYVAMTRAKDTLAIYTHQGKGKDPKPTKFLREFMLNPAYKKYWTTRAAAAVQDMLFAQEEERIALQNSNVAAWLLMPPAGNFVTSLSASAIDVYTQCPLRFKLEREWNLPREVAASLHYGAAMHGVLRTFYDAQRYERDLSDSDLLEQFRASLAAAGIPDRYQYELYLRQGIEQLTEFLQVARREAKPEVIETENSFDLKIEGVRLVGRIDRVDRLGSDGIGIVDYKTGKPKSQDDADESLQLSLYALAVREKYGKRPERLMFYNLENNTPVLTTRNDAELDEAQLHVREVAEAIADGDFSAKPGYHCAFCPYRNLCPATERVIAQPQKKTGVRTN